MVVAVVRGPDSELLFNLTLVVLVVTAVAGLYGMY